MGCFNNNGFYSHLPIEYGDEIVLIPCYYGDSIYTGENVEYSKPSMIGSTLCPLCFPLVGKYNDYGFIEDVKEDFNTRALMNKLNLPTLEELLRHIESWGDRVCGPRKGLEEVMKGNNEFDIKSAEPTLRDMDALGLKFSYSHLTYIIERKDVYDKIARMEHLGSLKEYGSKETYSKIYDRILGSIQDYYGNILTIPTIGSPTSYELNDKLHEAIRNKDEVLIKKLFDKINFARENVEKLNIMKTYDCSNRMNFNIVFDNIEIRENIKKPFFDFLGFLRYIHSHGGRLIESSYCSQEIYYDDYLEFEKYKVTLLEEIIKKKNDDED